MITHVSLMRVLSHNGALLLALAHVFASLHGRSSKSKHVAKHVGRPIAYMMAGAGSNSCVSSLRELGGAMGVAKTNLLASCMS